MKFCKDRRGFSLVELVIVMGIMAVFAGGVFGGLSYINRGKTKKAAASLDSKLSYIQTKNMTEKGSTYLYIFRKSDGVYTTIAQEKDVNGDGTISGVEETRDFSSGDYSQLMSYADSNTSYKLCSSQVTVSAEGSPNLVLDETNFIKIGYSKSTGAFKCCNNGSGSMFYDTIALEGNEKFSVKLVEKTGKHYVE